MAQTVQIVPTYAFPHVMTVINDYTVIADEVATTAESPITTYAFAVTADKGIDNKFIKCDDLSVANSIFGYSNFAKHGQPLLTALSLLDESGISEGNANVWIMRVMPENAHAANIMVSIGYKADPIYTDAVVDPDGTDVDYETVETTEDNVEGGDDYGNTTYTTTVVTTTVKTVKATNTTDGYTYTYVETTIQTVKTVTFTVLTTDENNSTGVYLDVDDDTEVEYNAGDDYYEYTYTTTTTDVSYTVTAVDSDGNDVTDSLSVTEATGSIPSYVTDTSSSKFRVKLTYESTDTIEDETQLQSKLSAWLNNTSSGDVDGYMTYPLMYIMASGRGSYGNNYGIRITQSTSYDSDYNMKVLCFTVLSTDGSVTTDATIMGSLVDTTRYDEIIQIEDVIDAANEGIVPIKVEINQDSVEAVYNAYVDFCTGAYDEIQTEYDSKYADYCENDENIKQTTLDNLLSGLLTYNEKTYSAYTEAYETLTTLQDILDNIDPDNIIDLDQFDPITGTRLGETTMLPLFEFVSYLSEEAISNLSSTDAAAYSSDNIADFSAALGVALSTGSDGYFDESIVREEDWTVDDEKEWCYKQAYNGSLDSRILTSKRIFVDAFFDANYPMSVKHTLADLAIARNDCICYLDTGVVESLSKYQLKVLEDEFEEYDDQYIISKNLHHYYIKESTTNKKVCVTITHFLAQKLAYHNRKIGLWIPMVKQNCQLSGHVKDSLAPAIEDYQKTLKDTLYKDRFNYFEVVSDNVFQRATQSTAQVTYSDLVEENNILTLYELKRGIEADCELHLYDFLDATVRKQFREYELAKYQDWKGKRLLDFDIKFESNEYEYNHSILHCYVAIKFRALIRYIINEIDVNKREYASDYGSDEE